MNIKKYIVSVLIGFISVFAFDFLWHGILLTDLYKSTAHLWRGPEAMQQYFPLATLMQLAFTAMLCWIFTLNFEEKGLGEGLRFGLYMGLFTGVMQIGIYPYIPIPLSLAGLWFLGSFLEVMGLGLIFSLSHK